MHVLFVARSSAGVIAQLSFCLFWALHKYSVTSSKRICLTEIIMESCILIDRIDDEILCGR